MKLVNKDASYFYKANWNKSELLLVHIAERCLVKRTHKEQTIKAFSNLKHIK